MLLKCQAIECYILQEIQKRIQNDVFSCLCNFELGHSHYFIIHFDYNIQIHK